MPRKARLDVPGTLHHVMVRGIEGRNIFQDEEDRKAFVNRMGNLVEETGTRILAWTLMDNHVPSADYQRAGRIVDLYAAIIDRLCL